MTPRIGDPPRRNQRYITRPGAYAVLFRKGQVLLTHQAEPEPEFQLPGGGIDPGENPITALHREIFEETGWRVDRLRRVGAFRRFTYMPEYDLWADKICAVYTARPTICRGDPAEPGHTAVWTSPAMAIELVENDGDRLFLARVLG